MRGNATRDSRTERLWRALIAATIAAVVGDGSLRAGQGVVSVNQHDFEAPVSCTSTHSCTTFSDPPFPAILDDETNHVDAFSYHINSDGGTPLNNSRFCRATCEFKYGNRPKILSTDRGYASEADLADWRDYLCAEYANSTNRGRLHLEHWDTALTDAGVEGKCLAGFTTWPQSSQDRAVVIADRDETCIPPLQQNGRIQQGNDSGSGLTKLYWRNHRSAPLSAVNLFGFGFMGAVAMGERLDQEAFLNSVFEKRGNFFRVWAVEQWTGGRAADPTTCGALVQDEGPNPFHGSLALPNGFSLDEHNPAYYSTLRSLVQHAADRGIVIQLSVFDKHGLIDKNGKNCQCWPQWGRFAESPYNAANNTTWVSPPPYIEAGWATCDCPPRPNCKDEVTDYDIFSIGSGCVPPVEFIQPEVTAHNNELIRRLAREVGGIGNVIFEVVNEAIAGADWPGQNSGWQTAVAEKIKLQLPTKTARDAFNGAPTSSLASRTPDWRTGSSGVWSTNGNVRIVESAGSPEGLQLGNATSIGQSGVGEMRAWIPFSAPSWTEATVRAEIGGTGDFDVAQVGFEDNAGNRIYLQHDGSQSTLEETFSPDAFCPPCTSIWYDEAGPTPPVLLKQIENPEWPQFLTLVVTKPVGTGTWMAYVGNYEYTPVAVPNINISKTYFAATGNAPIAPGAVTFDNFEANYYCNVTPQCSAAD